MKVPGRIEFHPIRPEKSFPGIEMAVACPLTLLEPMTDNGRQMTDGGQQMTEIELQKEIFKVSIAFQK